MPEIRAVAKTGDNLVGEVLRGQGTFYEWNHYPKGDVYDSETHSQYYYHNYYRTHAAGQRKGEHGHFHTFLRPKDMPAGIAPAPVPDFTPPKGDNDAETSLMLLLRPDLVKLDKAVDESDRSQSCFFSYRVDKENVPGAVGAPRLGKAEFGGKILEACVDNLSAQLEKALVEKTPLEETPPVPPRP